MYAQVSFYLLILIAPTFDGSTFNDNSTAIQKIQNLAKVVSFESVEKIVNHTFNMFKAIRDLGCDVTQLIQGTILL